MPRARTATTALCWLGLLCAGGSLHGQYLRIEFENVDLGIRRRAGTVRCVFQDATGYVWVGGRYGLWRCDGLACRRFPTPGERSPFRPDAEVRCLQGDASGRLWVGTSQGLAFVDPGAEAVVLVGPMPLTTRDYLAARVDDLGVDRRGRVWSTGAHRDLILYDASSGDTRLFSDPEERRRLGLGTTSRVVQVEVDARGDVWLATRDGALVRVDAGSDRAELLDWRRQVDVPEAVAVSLLCHTGDAVWVGTGQGLFRYDLEQRASTELRDGDRAFTGARRATCIARADDGRLWVGTLSAGLRLFESGARRAEAFHRDGTDRGSLPHDRIHALGLDRSGGLWVCTANGLGRADARCRFRYLVTEDRGGMARRRPVTAIHKDRHGTVWFGVGKLKLVALDPDGTRREYRPVPGEPDDSRESRIVAIAPAGGDDLWLGTTRGLYRIDRRGVVRGVFLHDPGVPTSLGSGRILAMHRLATGQLLIGTDAGIDRFDPDTGRAVRIDVAAALGSRPRLLVGGFFPARDDGVWAIFMHRRGGPENGLVRICPTTGNVSLLEPRGDEPGARPPARILAVLDRDSHLLLAAREGLFECRRDGTGLRGLASVTGLADRPVTSLLPGTGGSTWVGTSFDGLLLLDAERKTVRRFAMGAGSDWEPIYALCHQCAGDDELFIACGRGFLRFRERDVLYRARPPAPLVVNGFRVHGQPRGLSAAGAELRLEPGDNFFAFDFALLDFLDPSRNRYAYKLEGLDPDWVHSEARSARYSGIDPGEYVFRVKAVNADGTWSTTDAGVRIRVEPPFWSRGWVRAGMVVAGFVMLGTYLAYGFALARRGRRLQREYRRRTRVEQEARLLEAQLIQSQKLEAVGRLAGGIAHDFNNILTAILGNTELARDAARHDRRTEVLDGLDQVRQGAERAGALTRQLLAFCRGQPSESGVVDVNRVLRDLEPMLRRLVREDVELDLDLADRVPMVSADDVQLGQVVVNLVVNGSDAMPMGGSLSIRTRAVAGAVEIVIRDEGRGLSPEERARIFEPFYTSKPLGQGTGLGLSIVHGIVTQAGGEIELDSTQGVGTTFRVRLPATDAEPEEPAPVVLLPAGGSETVLLCEDDRAVLDLTGEILRNHGYRVIECNSPRQAIAVARDPEQRFDLLVTDVVMPEVSGPAVALAVREVRPAIGVLHVSGYTHDVLDRHGVDGEGFVVLQKPFTAEQLLRRVREVLDRAASA